MGHAHERDRQRPDGQQRRARSPSTPSPDAARAELEQLRGAVGNAAMSRMLDPHASRTIEASLGGGKPLREVASSQRVPRSDGADRESVDDVRVHDDADAAELSKQLGAVAFTFGRDIYLAGDAPDLDTAAGQHVMRHELTHVQQQRGATLGRPRKVSSPSSPAEREASHAGDHDSASTTAAADTVQRQSLDDVLEEEELMLMRADTVQRQSLDDVEEEEELMLMRADTVQRQSEEEEDAVTPQNLALAALFDGTVGENVRTAHAAMDADPPNGHEAYEALQQAQAGLRPLHATYHDSDPALQEEIAKMGNGLIAIINAIGPYLGEMQTQGWIVSNLGIALEDADEIKNKLH